MAKAKPNPPDSADNIGKPAGTPPGTDVVPTANGGALEKRQDALTVVSQQALDAQKTALNNLGDLIHVIKDRFGKAAAEYIAPIAKQDLGAALHLVGEWKKTGFRILENRARFTDRLHGAQRALSRIDDEFGMEADPNESVVPTHRADLEAAHAVVEGVERGESEVVRVTEGKLSRHTIVEKLLGIPFGDDIPQKFKDYFAVEGNNRKFLRLMVASQVTEKSGEKSPFEQEIEAFSADFRSHVLGVPSAKPADLATMTDADLERMLEQEDLTALANKFALGLITRVVKLRKDKNTMFRTEAVMAALSVSKSPEQVDALKKLNPEAFFDTFVQRIDTDKKGVEVDTNADNSSFAVRIVTNGGKIETFNPHNMFKADKERIAALLPDLRRVFIHRIKDMHQLLEDLPAGISIKGKVRNLGKLHDVTIKGLDGKDVQVVTDKETKIVKWGINAGETESGMSPEQYRDLLKNLEPDFTLDIAGAADRSKVLVKEIDAEKARQAVPKLEAPEAGTEA